MKKWLVAVCVMIIMITGCGKQNQVPGNTGKPVEEGVNVPSDSVSEGEKLDSKGCKPARDTNCIVRR